MVCDNDTDSTQAAVIAQSKLDSLLDLAAKPLKRSASSDRTTRMPSVKAKHETVRAPPRPGSLRTSGVVKVPRPKSGAKMQYKTSSSDIGKHLVKTRKPPSGATSRYAVQTRKQQGSVESMRTKPSINSSHSNERLSSDADLKKQTVGVTRSEGTRSEVKQADAKHGRHVAQSDCNSGSSSSDQQSSSVADLIDRTQRMSCSEDGDRHDEEIKPFLLQKDG